MTKQIKQTIPAALYAAWGWKSHELGRIIRQAHNLKNADRSAEDVLAFIFSDIEKLETQVSDILASWAERERFVEAKDEEGYIAWASERELARQQRLGVKVPRVNVASVADWREQFKRWLLEMR